GPRLRYRGDPADVGPRVRDAEPPPDRAVGVLVQRASDPVVSVGRLRDRGPGPRGDLARRSLVGRGNDEHPPIGLAGDAGAGNRGGGWGRRRERWAAVDAAVAGGRLPGSRPVTSTGPAAEAARADFRALMEAKGHAVENAREAVARLEAAFADGSLVRTPTLDRELGDLMRALEQDEGQKLGGKS